MIKESPKNIFLQLHENDGEITWSEDRINESDVEYVQTEAPTTHDKQINARPFEWVIGEDNIARKVYK